MRTIQGLLLITLIAILATSCATIDSTTQRLKLTSNPPNAEVIDKGEVIGRTPGFFKFDRQRRKTIMFRSKGTKEHDYNLSTRYRWADSFWGNLLLFNYAPAGWVIDWATGAAWRFEPLALQKLSQPIPERDLLKAPVTIAVAPPIADNEYLSNQIAERVYKHLKTIYPKAEILSYRSSKTKFDIYEYSFEKRASRQHLDRLSYKLAITHLAETKVSQSGDKFLLETEINDVFYEKPYQIIKFNVAKSRISYTKKYGFSKTMLSMLSLIPNTLYLDLGQNSSQVAAHPTLNQDEVFTGRPAKSQGLLALLSTIGIRNLRHSSARTGLRGTARFVPLFSLRYTKIEFPEEESLTPTDLKDQSYEWYTGKIGFGPELGLETTIGFFYLQFIPSLVGHWLDWPENKHGMQQRTLFSYEYEFGYSFFINDRFNLRLFASQMSVPHDMWKDALNDRSATPLTVKKVTHGLAGIAFGYYFPETKHWVHDTFD
jgi:hypothetical protein